MKPFPDSAHQMRTSTRSEARLLSKLAARDARIAQLKRHCAQHHALSSKRSEHAPAEQLFPPLPRSLDLKQPKHEQETADVLLSELRNAAALGDGPATPLALMLGLDARHLRKARVEHDPSEDDEHEEQRAEAADDEAGPLWASLSSSLCEDELQALLACRDARALRYDTLL